MENCKEEEGMNVAEKKCFRLVQEIVCERDRVCQRCGSIGPISAHHVFSRRNKGSAFEADSCLGLCPPCHDGWARKHPQEVHQLLTAILGYEHYTHLEYLSNQVVRLREADFKNIAVELQKKLEGMRGKV